MHDLSVKGDVLFFTLYNKQYEFAVYNGTFLLKEFVDKINSPGENYYLELDRYDRDYRLTIMFGTGFAHSLVLRGSLMENGEFVD